MKLGNKNSRGKLYTLSRMSDSQLVWLYNETGERKYYSELFMRYIPLLYGLCLKYIPSEEQAKAVIKRLFDHILEEFDKTEFYGDTFRDWLYVNSRRFIEDYARENRYQVRQFFSADMHNTLSSDAFEYSRILEKADRQAHLLFESTSGRLTKPEVTCIGMFFLKRKCFRSISATTGYLASAVKNYIESGLEKMAGSEIPESNQLLKEAQ
ncbi:MAG: hypothetical protein LUE10_05840 [Alistipes sp.]|nr:hypothetical protein [Alistipes sp.]